MAAASQSRSYLKIALFLSIVVNLVFVLNHLLKKYPLFHGSMVTQTRPRYYLNRQTIFDLLPVTNNDIVFAGDSHTQFFEAVEFLKNCSIKNRGIYDDVSSGLLDRMNEIVPGKPKKIFFEIGFNDIGYDVPADSVYGHIKMMIERIKQQTPNTSIYINSIFPSGREFYKPLVPVFNAKLKALCNTYKIPYIDVYSKLATNGKLNKRYDCGDGIHLNGAGYVVWSACLKPYL